MGDCGFPGNHVVPPDGFDRGRDNVIENWVVEPDPGHTLWGYGYWGNILPRIQCNGQAAASDGYVAFIRVWLDSDGDGVPDYPDDNCPYAYNPGQENFDADGPPIGNGPGVDNGRGIPGHDATVPNGDGWGDACDADDDNDGLPDAEDTNPLGYSGVCAGFGGWSDGHPSPAVGDNTNDDDGDGNPAPFMGTDASDSGPSWDTDNDGALDGAECARGHNPRNQGDTPSPAECGGNGDSDGDGLPDAWETCGWGTSTAVVDSDGDGLGDCVDAADVNGDGLVDWVADVLTEAEFAIIPGLCARVEPE